MVAEVGEVLVGEEVGAGVHRVGVVVGDALQHLHEGFHFVLTILKPRQGHPYSAIVFADKVDGVARGSEVDAMQGGERDGQHVEEGGHVEAGVTVLLV